MLLIDADARYGAAASRAIERGGAWHVIPLASGRDAIESCAWGLAVDLILIAAQMPGLDGAATLEWLRADGLPERTPVVFLVSDQDDVGAAELRGLGVVGAIERPPDAARLAAGLEQALRHRAPGSERVKGDLLPAWRRARPAAEARLAMIDDFLQGPGGAQGQTAAIAGAHMLAGLLGTFGLERGADLARKIELGLARGDGTVSGSCRGLAQDLRTAVEAG